MISNETKREKTKDERKVSSTVLGPNVTSDRSKRERERVSENTYLEEAHNLESGAHPQSGLSERATDLSNWRAGTPDYAIDSWRVFARPVKEGQ